MTTCPAEAHLAPVGALYRERRMRLNMSQDEVATEAQVNRDTVGAVEAGKSSLHSRRKVETALTKLEQAAGLPPMEEDAPAQAAPESPESAPPGFIRFKVEGVYGAKALVVEGPVENIPELEAAVDRIMRRLQSPDTGNE